MGQPKMLLPWRASTVIGTIVSRWRELGSGQIAVVMRPDDSALAAELDRLKISPGNRIENPQPERGMFSSVLCAANWSSWQNEITHWAIVLGDQPHLKTETLQALLNFATQNSSAICQPETGGSVRHPVVLPRAAFEELKNTQSETLKTFLAQTTTLRAFCRVDDDGLQLDMDTPEDYRRLAERIRA